VRLEGLGQMKNAMTSSGIEPVSFRLVALRLNQQSYHVFPSSWVGSYKCGAPENFQRMYKLQILWGTVTMYRTIEL
jgi:hypothetical protein